MDATNKKGSDPARTVSFSDFFELRCVGYLAFHGLRSPRKRRRFMTDHIVIALATRLTLGRFCIDYLVAVVLCLARQFPSGDGPGRLQRGNWR
ncbi:hypothetical protein L218DRAFT_659779 [Marasmius fiardii PR-910]|nr:hypothetical protein L218DRAFT_659779 [Marasmius fiardii PR-910]